jgi:FlgN protein
MMTVARLDDLLEVLAHRRKHCRDLLELSRRQNRVIDSGDYPQLMSILAQKQRILGRLDEIKRRYPDLGRQWSALRISGPAAIRSDCETIINETEAILAELLQTENEGAEQLSRRREATRRQLEGISEGVRVNESYRDNLAPMNHRFLDINR